MKNIKAFLIALLLFVITVAGIKVCVMRNMPEYNIKYGTWIQQSKFSCTSALNTLLKDKNTIPIFGSSELGHGQSSEFHANSIYKGTNIEPVFIGMGGYQSLYHAITLGALSNTLNDRKVILSVSPQWFKQTGVKKDAFMSSYSESTFIEFLKNKNINSDIKQYVIKRVESITEKNPTMANRIKDDIKWYMEGDYNIWEGIRKNIHNYLVNEKSTMKLFAMGRIYGQFKSDSTKNRKDTINFNKYYKKSKELGNKEYGGNDLGMMNSVYNNVYKFRIKNNMIHKPKYSLESVEYKDLECFMQLCNENNIELMVIVLPFNGKWCDFLDVKKSFRQKCYEKVKSLAKQHNAQITDLSGNEYSKYIFEDENHLAMKGLVEFNEKIYDFYKQNSK